MDLSLTRDTVKISEPIFDSAADHPVDCDIILPDYCPDIARMLKTESGVSVDSKVLESNRMTVNGTFFARVIYIPENSHSFRCITHDIPFSHTFEIGDGEGNLYSRASARVTFVNCRPLGPRRLQIRGSVSVGAKVWNERQESFISGSDDDRVELLRKPFRASTFVGTSDRPFEVNEELEIGYGKPAAASILKTNAVAVPQDYKVISNKIIAKGELLIKTLYVCESDDENGGALESMEHSIPISQIIDVDGVDEDCACEVLFNAGMPKVDLKADTDGENRIFTVSMPVTATARAFRPQEFNAVTDAYSPMYETKVTNKNLSFEHVADVVKSNEMVRQTVGLENVQLASINDAGVTAAVTEAKPKDGGINLAGDMNISLLGADPQGSPVSVEKTMPFAIRLEVREAPEQIRCEPDIKVVSCGYSMQGPDTIDLRVECAVSAVVYGVSNENAVVDLTLDEQQPKSNEAAKTLTLYYADEGESVWNIAKHYNTSVDAIKRENNIDVDQLEGRSVLLIPKKRGMKK